MKKVLFATSALVMSAGFAVAEVAVSGDGRMGVIYDGDDVQFSSRARVLFTLTGESDAGLSFGGQFRVDQQDEAGGKASDGTAGVVWISGTYGKLSMGDPVGAAEAAIGDLYAIGYTDGTFAGDMEEVTYLVGDGANTDQGPTILYEYSIDNIGFFASATDGNGGDDEVAYSLAANYDAGNWKAGLAYSKHGDASEIGLCAEANFDAFSVKAVYMHYDDRFGGIDPTDRSWEDDAAGPLEWDYTIGLAAAYNVDAWTIKGFVRQDKAEVLLTGDSAKLRTIGIGADYDLGGGAVLAGGIANQDLDVAGVGSDETVADLGIKFKF